MGKSKEMFNDMRQAEIEQEAITPSISLSRSITTLRSLDAAAIDTLAKAQINEVADGLKDGVDLFTLATKGKMYFETLVDNLKPHVYAKQLAQKGDVYVKNGVELSSAELGVKYDYKSSQDPEWTELNAKFEAAKKAKEEREKFLKGIKGKLNFVNDDGEGFTIYEPVKSGQMGYKTKIL